MGRCRYRYTSDDRWGRPCHYYYLSGGGPDSPTTIPAPVEAPTPLATSTPPSPVIVPIDPEPVAIEMETNLEAAFEQYTKEVREITADYINQTHENLVELSKVNEIQAKYNTPYNQSQTASAIKYSWLDKEDSVINEVNVPRIVVEAPPIGSQVIAVQGQITDLSSPTTSTFVTFSEIEALLEPNNTNLPSPSLTLGSGSGSLGSTNLNTPSLVSTLPHVQSGVPLDTADNILTRPYGHPIYTSDIHRNPILRNIFFRQVQANLGMNDEEFHTWLESPSGFLALARSANLEEPMF